MCLLVFKPAGVKIPAEHLYSGCAWNADGAGIAWSDGRKCQIAKGYFDADNFVEDATSPKLINVPCIYHMRFATHGSKSKENTQPFKAAGGWVMGHNGIIPDMRFLGKESDTAAFVRDVVNPITSRNPKAILEPKVQKHFFSLIGSSKLVFLHGSGEWTIVGEGRGEWFEDVWYSNNTYEDRFYFNSFAPLDDDDEDMFTGTKLAKIEDLDDDIEECAACGQWVHKNYEVFYPGAKKGQIYCWMCGGFDEF
jgi:glutamine amidotransferase